MDVSGVLADVPAKIIANLQRIGPFGLGSHAGEYGPGPPMRWVEAVRAKHPGCDLVVSMDHWMAEVNGVVLVIGPHVNPTFWR